MYINIKNKTKGKRYTMEDKFKSDKMELDKKVIKRVLFFSICLIILVLIIMKIRNNSMDMTDKLAYEITSEENQYKVKTTDVVKEKGKETTYTIELDGSDFCLTIPESVYNEYIGDKYNTITVKEEYLTVYIASKPNNFKSYEIRDLRRCSFPWDNKPVEEFTKENAEEVINVIKEIGESDEKWAEAKLSFDYDKTYGPFDNGFGYGEGHCADKNQIFNNEGAIMYKE